jgi:hypothetical protein
VASVSRRSRLTRFFGLALAATAGLAAIGYLPTRRLAGDAAVSAMFAGCGISLTAAAVAGVVVVLVDGATPMARIRRWFLAMTVRVAIVLVLAVAAALSGVFARTPLLFWVAAAYVVLLPFEVGLAITGE